jgi:Uncharacterized protein conserved in bacteria (DUF2087)
MGARPQCRAGREPLRLADDHCCQSRRGARPPCRRVPAARPGAVALGATALPDIAERARLTEARKARALGQLVGAGIASQGRTGLEVDLAAFARAARAAPPPRQRPTSPTRRPSKPPCFETSWTPTAGFGSCLPARRSARSCSSTSPAGSEQGWEYAEADVNDRLLELYDDYVTLRRYLVDAGLLTRSAGVYRRGR